MPITVNDLVRAFHNGDSTFNYREGEFKFKWAPRDDPEITWLAIVELSRQPLSDEQIALLAAGPLEDVLAHHGEAFIDRVEREARVYRAFRHLLGGVWRNSIPEPVWIRIQKIRGKPW